MRSTAVTAQNLKVGLADRKTSRQIFGNGHVLSTKGVYAS